MSGRFERDVFLCFAGENKAKVTPLRNHLEKHGLTVFDFKNPHGGGLVPAQEIEPELQRRLECCQHLLIYWTTNAQDSPWVKRELEFFDQNCRSDGEPSRRVYVFEDQDEKVGLPSELDGFVIAESVDQLTSEMLHEALREKAALEARCARMVHAVEEARHYYQHDRFWRAMSRNRHVHIFTCARDLSVDRNGRRGRGGRTVIDKWDYRAVLEIMHFFASKYPNVEIRIEDPISKLDGNSLKRPEILANKMTDMRGRLANKDCIIVGSPDVSDFAEIVLAKIHGINPYDDDARQSNGYVIIKVEKNTSSSFYWRSQGSQEEGIGKITGREVEVQAFPHEPAEAGKSGKMYGILVVANNPFCSPGQKRKIMILSGFSGVSTNAIAKFITNEECLDEFFKLDEKFVNVASNVEALVGVSYDIDDASLGRDTRKIVNPKTDITFEGLVDIGRA